MVTRCALQVSRRRSQVTQGHAKWRAADTIRAPPCDPRCDNPAVWPWPSPLPVPFTLIRRRSSISERS